jgi:Zn-dependent peptidase ImmA (M78 family)
MMEYIGLENIEKRVEGIIKFFGKKIRVDSQIEVVPVYDYLQNHKGISFEFDSDLGENSDGSEILGKYNVSSRELLITNRLKQNSARWRFTAAHELGHFLYHRYLFKAQHKKTHIDTENSITWGALKGLPTLRLEWQANAFASAMLLPRKMVFASVLRLLKENNVSNYGHGLIYLDEQLVNIDTYQRILRAICSEFNVSFQCAYYRLLQLKILNNQLKMKNLREISDCIPILRKKRKVN